MKRYLAGILVLMMIALAMPLATAETYYNWVEPTIGVVISTSVSIRELPKDTSTRLYSAKNMDELVIVDDWNEWYVVDCYKTGLSKVEKYGYVLKRFVNVNGYNICLSGAPIDVYTDPWSGMCNGQKAKAGETLYVIYETNQWLVCQLKTEERTPGSCFIKKSDLGMSSSSYYESHGDYSTGYITAGGQSVSGTRWMVIYDSDGVSVGIRVEPDLSTEMLEIIHSGDIVTVLRNNGEFAYVRYVRQNGQEVYGWVRTMYFVLAN